jgi:hypothetical protein
MIERGDVLGWRVWMGNREKELSTVEQDGIEASSKVDELEKTPRRDKLGADF